MEIWKDIPNYEGYYQASNLGRIKSLHKRPIILKTGINPATGYLFVQLCKNGNIKGRTVHSILAETFVANPENKPCVNHIDGNKLNNSIANLEWVTYSENNTHKYRVLGMVVPWLGKEKKKGKYSPFSKPVICMTTNERFDCVREASESLNIPVTAISKVCTGKRPRTHGLIFKYA